MAYLQGEYAQYIGAMGNYDRFDPLLVSLHDSLRLFKYDQNGDTYYNSVEASILDILDARLQDTEKAIVTDIIIGIVKQARHDIQKTLSEKLSFRDDLPATLLHYLAYADIHVAQPVLLNSTQLSDVDIMYIIQSKGQDHWRVIARRPEINENVIACLTAKKDAETNIGLLENDTISMSSSLIKQIAAIAGTSEALADKLVAYKDLPQQVAVSLYWHVSTTLRQDIKNRFGIEGRVIDEALEDTMQDFTDSVLQCESMKPSKTMIDIAQRYHAEGRIDEDMLVECLRRRQGRFFIALFACRTKLSHSVVWTMMRQSGGQGLAVASRATNISKKNFVSIFLLSGTLARSQHPVSGDELRMAIRYYEGLSYKVAKDILCDSIAV